MVSNNFLERHGATSLGIAFPLQPLHQHNSCSKAMGNCVEIFAQAGFGWISLLPTQTRDQVAAAVVRALHLHL